MRYSNLKLGGAVAALMLATTPAAFAAGTTALTAIESTVNITFTRGANTVSDSAAVTFYVDRKVDFLTESTHGGAVDVDLGDPDSNFTGSLVYTLVNTSNATIDYAITTAGAVPAAGATGSVTSHALQISRDGGATWSNVAAAETLAADEEVQLRILATFAPNTNGTFDFNVAAQPTAAFAEVTGRSILTGGAGAMNTVHLFEAVDTNDTATFEVSSPVLTAEKTVTVIDQAPADGFDCADGAQAAGAQAALPGACIEYTITVNNTGGGAMRNLSLTDNLPAQVTYAGHFAGPFTVNVTGNNVSATHTGNLTAGNSAVLRIRATIN